MSKHDEGRRAFLVGTALGAGAAASVSLVPEALAKSQKHHVAAADAPAAARPAGVAVPIAGEHHRAFFNDDDAHTVTAFAERLMPGAPGKPGATDADVLNYIDLALAGSYSELQDFYRRGLASLDSYCRSAYKESFVHLAPDKQDEVITALEADKATGFTFPTAREFFSILRTHTMEGMFADPLYGGNRDFAGWRLVAFPGAQAIFTPSDLQSKQAFVRAPIVGLQSTAKGPVGRG